MVNRCNEYWDKIERVQNEEKRRRKNANANDDSDVEFVEEDAMVESPISDSGIELNNAPQRHDRESYSDGNEDRHQEVEKGKEYVSKLNKTIGALRTKLYVTLAAVTGFLTLGGINEIEKYSDSRIGAVEQQLDFKFHKYFNYRRRSYYNPDGPHAEFCSPNHSYPFIIRRDASELTILEDKNMNGSRDNDERFYSLETPKEVATTIEIWTLEGERDAIAKELEVLQELLQPLNIMSR